MKLTFSSRRAGPGWVLVLGFLAGTLVADLDDADFGVPPTPAGHAGEGMERSSGRTLPEGEDTPVCIPQTDRSVVGGLSSYDLRLSESGRVRADLLDAPPRSVSEVLESPSEPAYLQIYLSSNPHHHRAPPG